MSEALPTKGTLVSYWSDKYGQRFGWFIRPLAKGRNAGWWLLSTRDGVKKIDPDKVRKVYHENITTRLED